MLVNINCFQTIISIGSSIATIITGVVAVIALYSWKHQIHYNLRMEALANSRIAFDIVSTLRNPFNYEGEINDGFLSEHLRQNGEINPIEKQYLLFQSRLFKQAQFYTQILTIREKLWATFSESHKLFKFYDEVTATIRRIQMAHIDRINLAEQGLTSEEEFKNLHKVTINQGVGDEISKKLQHLLDDITKRR